VLKPQEYQLYQIIQAIPFQLLISVHHDQLIYMVFQLHLSILLPSQFAQDEEQDKDDNSLISQFADM